MKGEETNHSKIVESITSGKIRLPEGYSLPEQQEHQDSFATVREATYRDKTIRIETIFKIMIDNKPVGIHTQVLKDGSVHCHAFPNYSFQSAMDMVRKIIDDSLVQLPKNELGKPDSKKHGGCI